MSGSIQSSNYVPGASGWKFNEVTGEFEIHTSTATAIADPQPITVTAGDWSEFDLPVNAIERYAFIGAELQKIPDECRESAKLSTEDHSYYPGDSSDVRTTLTYVRQETPEEVQARIQNGSAAAQMAGLVGGGFSIFHNGQLRVHLGSLERPSPFVVADGKVYLRDDLVKEASIANAKVANECSVRVELSPTGQPYAAGFGIDIGTAGELKPDIIVKASHMEILPDGLVKTTQAPKHSEACAELGSQYLVTADKFAINGRDALDILRDIACKIGETELGQSLKEQLDLLGSNLAHQVRAVIREELMPGGLLHRSR